MSLEYEKEKYKILKKSVTDYKQELYDLRELAYKLPVETDNGFNVEREQLIDDYTEKLTILNKHFDDPYFAKLEFVDITDQEEFKGYIGRVSVGDISNPSDEKIVDWRAPIAELYYNGRVGLDAYYAFDKKYDVNLKLKRQVNIKNNQVQSIYDFEDSISSDEFLKPFLTQSADNRLKSIVATIQEEQNAIIRYPYNKNCIVQGVAGSGKTTVALHRLSYLMYNFKERIKAVEFLIISPSQIFMSYILNILYDLDAEKSNSLCIEKIFNMVVPIEYKILNKDSQYNRLQEKNISIDYLRFKSSLIYLNMLDSYIQDYKEQLFKKPLVVRGVELLPAEMVYKYFSAHEGKKIIDQIEHGIKSIIMALRYDSKVKDTAEANLNKVSLELQERFKIKRIIEEPTKASLGLFKTVKFDMLKMYEGFLNNIEKYTDYQDINILKTQSQNNLKNKTISYDDIAPIMYLSTYFYDYLYFNNIKQILIDEAQDFSIVMFTTLKRLFPHANFSVFGDIAQGIFSYQSIESWQDVLQVLGECDLMHLNKSYRSTIEITNEANNTLTNLGFMPASNVVRHGEPIVYERKTDKQTVLEQVNRLTSKYNNVAIICKNTKELEQASKDLSDLNLVIINENNLSFDNCNRVLLTVQTAKGLEFDSVIIYNHKTFSTSAFDQRLLYVAKTRALHELIINGYEKNKHFLV